MVKTPRTRHSKAEREPVTIELEPDEVSRLAADDDTTTTEQTPDAAKEDIGASRCGGISWPNPAPTQP